MAYQSKIDMTIEVFKGLCNRLSSNTTRALDIFNAQKQVFNSFHNSGENSLIKNIPTNLQFVSGFPGSEKEALELISNLIAYLFQCGSYTHDVTSCVIDSTNRNNADSSTKLDGSLTEMCSIFKQIDSIKKSFRVHDSKLTKKIAKYQKSINNIITLKTKIKKQSEITHLYEKILAIREKNKNRLDFITSAENCVKQITYNLETAIQLMKEQSSIKKEIISTIINTNQQTIIKCDEVSSQVMSSLNVINFQKDYQNYINNNKIIRYDLLPEKFVPVDFKHECFSKITTISNVFSLQLYPYAMAKTKKDFVASDDNEISVQKGKIILLMEDLSLDWAFIQNPYTKLMGYAPSSFFELIGNGLGVVLDDYKSDDEILHKGDYIAIVGYSKSGSQTIHTISDINTLIPESLIGVISEF